MVTWGGPAGGRWARTRRAVRPSSSSLPSLAILTSRSAPRGAAALAYLHAKRVTVGDVKSPNFLLFRAHPAVEASGVQYTLKIGDVGCGALKAALNGATPASSESPPPPDGESPSPLLPRGDDASPAAAGGAGGGAGGGGGGGRLGWWLAPNWRAPEVWASQKPVETPQADIYGLGCVLYELASHSVPWTAAEDVATLQEEAAKGGDGVEDYAYVLVRRSATPPLPPRRPRPGEPAYAIGRAVTRGLRPAMPTRRDAPSSSSSGGGEEDESVPRLFWDIVEACWAPLPSSRPAAPDVLRSLDAGARAAARAPRDSSTADASPSLSAHASPLAPLPPPSPPLPPLSRAASGSSEARAVAAVAAKGGLPAVCRALSRLGAPHPKVAARGSDALSLLSGREFIGEGTSGCRVAGTTASSTSVAEPRKEQLPPPTAEALAGGVAATGGALRSHGCADYSVAVAAADAITLLLCRSFDAFPPASHHADAAVIAAAAAAAAAAVEAALAARCGTTVGTAVGTAASPQAAAAAAASADDTAAVAALCRAAWAIHRAVSSSSSTPSPSLPMSPFSPTVFPSSLLSAFESCPHADTALLAALCAAAPAASHAMQITSSSADATSFRLRLLASLSAPFGSRSASHDAALAERAAAAAWAVVTDEAEQQNGGGTVTEEQPSQSTGVAAAAASFAAALLRRHRHDGAAAGNACLALGACARAAAAAVAYHPTSAAAKQLLAALASAPAAIVDAMHALAGDWAFAAAAADALSELAASSPDIQARPFSVLAPD